VLFCTGAAMAGSLGFGGEAVHALGVRLLCVDRPGLGLSEPDGDKSLGSWARDVGAVLAALGLVRPRAVGFSQGAPFAVALAASGLTSALALVSGQDELAHPSLRPLLGPDVARLVDAVAADRARFEADFAARVDAQGMWSLVLGMSAPEDRARYEEPAFAAAFRASLEGGFAQGPAGYVRDLALALGRWALPPEEVRVPVHLWYGGRDTSPVHSPDAGATLQGRFPRAWRSVLEAEGGSLLWTRGGDVLAELLRA
jgi:pimeloyl-ACP methyl ester carboxylesterase